MARAIWKGSISFGLVNIPVELHSAVRDNRPRFHLLHAKDRSPIKYQRVCQREGKEVEWNDVVKGYQFAKGRFVIMTKGDFEAAALEKSRTIDIVDFVKSEEIDDRYFETSYYLVPPKGGERAYALLREALRESGRVGVAKMILREDQHLAAISVHESAMVLTMMRFADEVVAPSEFDLPDARQIRGKELDMAKTLVANLADKWSPGKYTDEYRNNVMRIIEAKIKGREPQLESTTEPVQADVVDLMERLRQSLGQAPARRHVAAVAAQRAPHGAPRPKPAKATLKRHSGRKKRTAA